MPERHVVAVYDAQGRFKGVTLATGAQLAAAKRQQAIAAEQNKRFRNAPRDLTEAMRDPAWLAGQGLSLALSAGGISGVGNFFSAMLSDFLRRDMDLTVGRAKSPLRAVGGLPFSGVRNLKTGIVTTPPTVAQIVAATKAAVQGAVAKSKAKPGTWVVPWAQKGGAGGKGAGAGGGGGPSTLGGRGGNVAGSNRGNKQN